MNLIRKIANYQIVSECKLKSSEELFETYLSYREAGKEVGNEILKFFSKDSMLACGKKLGIVRKKTLIFNNEDEMSVLMNYYIFHHYINGKTTIDRYALFNHDKVSGAKKIVLEAMACAEFAILGVEKTLPNGGVLVKNLLSDGATELLIDKGFSQSAVPGLILASTILRYPKFIATTGAALPIHNIVDELNTLLAASGQQYDGFNAMPKVEQSKLVTSLTKVALQNNASESIRYQDA